MVGLFFWIRWMVVAICILVSSSAAWATSAELRVSGQELQVGQVAQLQVVVTGQQPNGVPVVQFPQSGLNVQFTGQSSQVNSINGRTTRRFAYNFQLEALAQGSFQVGPATVQIGGNPVVTKPVRIRVKERVRMSSELLEAFSEWSVSNAWVGQVVLYRRGVRTRRPINQDAWSQLPQEGTRFVDEVQPKYSEYRISDPDGDIYIKEEYHPRITTKAGTFESPPAVARVAVVVGQTGRGLFTRYQTELEVLTVPKTLLQVQALPPAPDGFSGLVGEFTVKGSLEKTEATVGTSIPWTVTVDGEGALGRFDWSLDNTQKGARIYDGTPTRTSAIVDGRFLSRATFEQVIVPTEPGTLLLPPAKVITFSPKRGEYVTHSIDIPQIEVAQGTAKDGTLKTFVGQMTHPETLVQEPAYEGVREAIAVGPATRLRLGRVLQGLQLLAGIPILAWVLGRGMIWARRRAAQRAAKRIPKAFDPISALSRVPSEDEARWAYLAHVLTRMGGRDLDPKAVHLLEQIGAVRYGDKTAEPGLEEAIRAYVVDAVKTGEVQS